MNVPMWASVPGSQPHLECTPREAPDGTVAVAIVNFDTVAHTFAARVAETGASVTLDAAARSVQLVDAGRRPPPAHQQPAVV